MFSKETAADSIIPPIRFLYNDDCGHDELTLQLQSADIQSCLSWEDVIAVLEDEVRLPDHPVELVEQVTTMILMEDQVTDFMFSSIKRLIWSKMSRFIQGVSIVTNQLSQGELSCLWENNKHIMMLFLMGEMFSNRLELIIQNIINKLKFL